MAAKPRLPLLPPRELLLLPLLRERLDWVRLCPRSLPLPLPLSNCPLSLREREDDEDRLPRPEGSSHWLEPLLEEPRPLRLP